MKGYRQWFLGLVKRAIYDYAMIKIGDRVAVGISGGKDSTSLLHALWLVSRTTPLVFGLEAVYIDLGFGADISAVEAACRERGIPFHTVKTEIGAAVKESLERGSPCALCAHLRRGALNNAARGLGCGAVALGHHLDDAIETFFMSLFYNGQFRTFAPVTFLDRANLRMIRPLIYLTAKDVSYWAKTENLPAVENPCPASGRTAREEARRLVEELAERYPDLRLRFLNAFKTHDPRNLWPAPLPKKRGET